jgi:hypothetical protein
MKVIVALLVMLSLTGKAWSETVRTLGPGSSSSCGAWLENRRSSNYYAMGAWALGYLSGAATFSIDLDPLASVDADAVFYWLDNYCRIHPINRFVDAVRAFVEEHPK